MKCEAQSPVFARSQKKMTILRKKCVVGADKGVSDTCVRGRTRAAWVYLPENPWGAPGTGARLEGAVRLDGPGGGLSLGPGVGSDRIARFLRVDREWPHEEATPRAQRTKADT